jgi:hypothetical protein
MLRHTLTVTNTSITLLDLVSEPGQVIYHSKALSFAHHCCIARTVTCANDLELRYRLRTLGPLAAATGQTHFHRIKYTMWESVSQDISIDVLEDFLIMSLIKVSFK